MHRDPIDVARIVPSELRAQPGQLIDYLSNRFYQTRSDSVDRDAFRRYFQTKQPDTSDQTLRGLVHLMMSTPQFQLA